jgi:hypothetical protein
MKVIRIFPRKTKATPDDENVIINRGPNLFDEADEVHVSVTFTWDIQRAEKLAYMWRSVAPVSIGGPAFNEVGGEFELGMYLKEGYTITSRGCNNKCWFCSVWKRENGVRELKINPGYNLIDDNILACSDQHIKAVFEMLKLQKHPISFTGGIEAKLLRPWHIDLFTQIRLKELFCAYDTPDDYEPLIEAGKTLKEAGITYENRKARCYILIGYPNDTFDKALLRIRQTLDAGFFPFAMLWRNEKGEFKKEWKRFQREWANPIITAVNCKKMINKIIH